METNDAVTWVDLKEEIRRARIKKIWPQASKHTGGDNMEKGADFPVVHRHYKGLVKAGKHREAGALMTICTGACWSAAEAC